MCFDVKFDPSRKALLVSWGNMAGARDYNYYCVVVNINTAMIDLLFINIDNLEVATTDVGNDYLHVFYRIHFSSFQDLSLVNGKARYFFYKIHLCNKYLHF